MRSGTYVKVRGKSIKGRIYHVYTIPMSVTDGWYDHQLVRLGPQPRRFINERWYAIVIHRPQSFQYTESWPESLLEEVEPFVLSNPEGQYYLSEPGWK